MRQHRRLRAGGPELASSSRRRASRRRHRSVVGSDEATRREPGAGRSTPCSPRSTNISRAPVPGDPALRRRRDRAERRRSRACSAASATSGEGEGLVTDLGQSIDPFRSPSPARQAFGALSARVKGERDLDPVMRSASTRLARSEWSAGASVSGSGSIEVTVNGSLEAHRRPQRRPTRRRTSSTRCAPSHPDHRRRGATCQDRPGLAATGFASIFGNALAITIADPGAPRRRPPTSGLDTTYPPAPARLGFDVDPRITEDQPLVSSLSGVTVPLGHDPARPT